MVDCYFKSGRCFCPDCSLDSNRVELFFDENIGDYFCDECLRVFKCSELPELKKELKKQAHSLKYR